ncbi:MAG TPA: HAMP domain-containing sensor histidine kinase [Myxococcota bacterium]|nr:HAMP domain-containing sensor histidine kinase [Myxococcota bacterium]
MRLVRKLTLTLLAGFAVIFAIQAWLSMREFAEAYEADISRDHRVMGRALAAAVAASLRDHGPDAAVSMIAEADARELQTEIRWVHLDAAPGSPGAPALPREQVVPAELGHDVSLVDRSRGNHGMVYTYTPVVVDGRVAGEIELSQSLEGEQRFIHVRFLHEIAVTAALVLVCGGVAWLLGVRLVGEPVRQLAEQARRIGAGDLSSRINLRQHDELSLLADEMNTMTDNLAEARVQLESETAARLAAIEQVRHADRLATVGQLASGIAHELGTPLNVISGHAAMIASGEVFSELETRETACVIHEQTNRMVGILRQLLDFARRKSTERSPADLVKLARETVAFLEPLAAKRGVVLDFVDRELVVPAEVDTGQIEQVLTNLVVNAIQASPPGAHVQVQAMTRRLAPKEGNGSERRCVCVEVRDRGEGISGGDRARIFDPFFTTKPVGEGTGLGLSVAYGIVADHGGWIDVTSEAGRGSVFTVWLPQGGGLA